VGITFTAPEGLGAPAAKLAAVASNAVVTAYQQQRLTQIKSQTNRESTDLNSELSTVNSQLLNVEGQINALQQQENAAAAAQQTQEQALLNEGQKVPATSTPPQDAQLASLQTLETNLTQRQSDLLTQLDNLQSAEQQSLNQPLGVIPATESSKPSRPNMVADVGIGAALLLVLGAIAAYVLALYRRRFSDRHEPEGLYGAALLGDIPDFKSEHIESALPIVDARMSVAAESFRFIVASLRSVSADTELGVIAVTTANGASGKTTVTANLALALAESGCRVLAIDGDFVRWGLSALLSGHELSHDRSGLAEVISGRTKLVDAVVPCALRGGDLVDLLPPGAAQPRLPISDSKEAHAFLAESAAYYDYVILDGLPLEQAAYGWDVISFANSTIMVVRHKEPVRPHLELPELLDRTETRLIGYVYNRGPLRRNVGSYYRRFSGASSAGTASQNGKEASTPNVIDSALHRSLSESR
jgi:Mrp family chromosome partitioning ATPase